jgi:hypothetical protein
MMIAVSPVVNINRGSCIVSESGNALKIEELKDVPSSSIKGRTNAHIE